MFAERPRGDTFLFWALVFAFYNDWYCYPFGITSSETSPTYSDRPGWVSAIKYILYFALCAGAVLRALPYINSRKIRRPIYLVVYGCLFLIPLVYAVLGELGSLLQCEPFFSNSHIPLKRIVHTGLFFMSAILLHVLPLRRVNLKPVKILITVTLVVYLVVEVIEILAFYCFGRLPSLAYENSIIVRFGSLLDEPNCFGIMTSMFFGLIFSSVWRYRTKAFFCLSLFVALLLTESYTGWAATMIACGTYAIIRPPRLTYATVISLLGLLVLLVSIGVAWHSSGSDLFDTAQQLVEAKSESADLHAQSLYTLQKYFGIANVFGLEPRYEGVSAESQYVAMALTEGGLYIALFMVAMIAGLVRCAIVLRRKESEEELRVVASVSFCFLVAIVVAGISQPVMAMFPLNLLTALMLGVSSSGMLEQRFVRLEGAMIVR